MMVVQVSDVTWRCIVIFITFVLLQKTRCNGDVVVIFALSVRLNRTMFIDYW